MARHKYVAILAMQVSLHDPTVEKEGKMKSSLAFPILISAVLASTGPASTTESASVTPGTQINPAITNKSAPATTSQPLSIVRVTATTSLKQLLAMPDTTVVQSADGTQTATVGAIRGQIRARQQQIESAVEARKLLTGGIITVPVAHGLSALTALRARIKEENSTALALRNANLSQQSRIDQKLNLPPGIYSVNGKKSGFVLSPGENLVIKGIGFGNSKGLTVIRGLPRGDVELAILDWRDDEIFAQVPATPSTMSGLPDGTVSIVMFARQDQQYRLDGGTFYANRANIILTDLNAAKMYQIHFDPAAPLPLTRGAGGFEYRESWDFGDDPSKLNTCWSPGTDYLTTTDPGHGFVVTALTFAWGRGDSGDGDGFGDAGSRVFTPGYSLGDWNGDTLPVHWGVWRSHHSPYLWVPSIDYCMTQYTVTSVTLTGPAGILF